MLSNIQALRALAALLVVTAHLSSLLPASPWFTWGGSGVDLFFAISGYIMVRTTGTGTTPVGFATKRVARIVPLYWLVTFATFAVALVAPHLFGSTRADLGELGKSLAFIPFVKGSGYVQPLVFVGWTLNYEMFFYAIFALGLFFGRAGVWFTSAALAALVLAGPLGSGPIWAFYTSPILLEFIAGMVIARLDLDLPPRPAAALLVVGLVAIPVLTALLPDLDRGYRLLAPVTAVLAGAVSLERRGARCSSALVLLLGDASYAIYLIHPFVTQAATKALGHLPEWTYAPGAALVLVIAAAVGVAVYFWVERPIQLRLRRPFRESTAGAAPAAA